MADYSTTHGEGELGQAKLSYIDSIVAREVLKDAQMKFKLLTALAPDIATHQEAITAYVSKEIERIIRKQQKIEAEFQRQVVRRDEAISQNESREAIQALNASVQSLAAQIQDSTKELCKNLKENPSVTDNLRKTEMHRNEYLELITKALKEFVQNDSYLDLEKKVSDDYQFLQEFQKQQQSEQQARAEVEALKEEIRAREQQHAKFMAEKSKELGELKEDLQCERQRVTECLALLREELQAGGDEMRRVRAQEIAFQQTKIDALLNAIEEQQRADEQAIKQVQKETDELMELANYWGQKKDNTFRLLETEKAELERISQEKKDLILKLEEECRRNRQERKEWEEEQVFQAKMRQATYETRKIRLEMSRAFLELSFKDALVTKLNRKKGKKK